MGIGFYARGPISLPHPPYPKATLDVIERAIAEAWKIIRDHPEGDFDIKTADEDRITRELRTCLVNRVLADGLVPGFTSSHFRVTREGKFESFDGTHLDKMPDLHIDVVRDTHVSLPSADGLFVDCKPVDRQHAAGGAYCDKGIIRFVNGQYAWALPQGMMVGYASAGYAVPGKLRSALRTRKTTLRLQGEVQAGPNSSAAGHAQHPQITVHGRDFSYPSTGTKAPHITIRHLWLNKE